MATQTTTTLPLLTLTRCERTRIAVAYALAQAARHSVGSSAALCLEDAEACYTAGAMEHAYQRALRSLSHSVGIFHPDYTEAANMAQ